MYVCTDSLFLSSCFIFDIVLNSFKRLSFLKYNMFSVFTRHFCLLRVSISFFYLWMIHIVASFQFILMTFISLSHRWRVGEFGRCSKDCGGGVQYRRVECIQGNQEVSQIVDIKLCPLPAPKIEQICNNHTCGSLWSVGQWSHVSG